MLSAAYAAFLSAALFYALIPVFGAFIARSSWRAFRDAVAAAAALPRLRPGLSSPRDMLLEGEVEALAGDDELWVRGHACSAKLAMAGASIVTLGRGRGAADGAAERRSWAAVRSVRPGIRVFAAGRFEPDGLIPRLNAAAPGSLVVLHDGSEPDAAARAIRDGRHPNEYWNPVTKLSLAAGLVICAAIASTSLGRGEPALVSALTLVAATAPALPLLPPGLVGFLTYRAYWRRARYCRSRRDLAAFRGEEPGSWGRLAAATTALSAGAFAAAILINAWIGVELLRRLL